MMLVEFYTKYERLITTTMEVIRRANKVDISNDVEALIKRTKSHRDRSTYSVILHSNNQTLRNLSWGRLVLSVIQDYVSETPSSIDELTRLFDLPKDGLKIFDPNKPSNSGYFDRNVDMPLLPDDTKCLVKKGWSRDNLKKFIEAANNLQYQIEKTNKK